MKWLWRVAAALPCLAVYPIAAAPAPRPYTVESYEVRIQPDWAQKRLNGEARMRLHNQAGMPIAALELDAGALQIANVLDGEAGQYFERKGRLLFVALTNPLRTDEERTLTIRYQAVEAPGLRFYPDQIYTTAPSDWMPCNNRSGEHATLHLTLSAPRKFQAAASGQLTATRSSEGLTITEWQLDSGTAPAWFGFALGSFAENTSQAESVKLRVLGAGSQVFEPTTAALRYLSERTGKAFPGQIYTQVFVHGDAVRSLAGGLTFLPESFAQSLKQPDTLAAMAAQLAHQWYGFGIGVKDWSDLWLSEGIAAFLGDTFLGERLGKEAYERRVESSRQIYNRFRAEDKDRSLSDNQWTTFEEAAGDIPVHKGVSFLYLVKALVGDAAFWAGLRAYTSELWGKAATSEDFQRIFVAAGGSVAPAIKKNSPASPRNAKNGKALANLFDLWVYGIPLGKSK